jgi:hypothetical protein
MNINTFKMIDSPAAGQQTWPAPHTRQVSPLRDGVSVWSKHGQSIASH